MKDKIIEIEAGLQETAGNGSNGSKSDQLILVISEIGNRRKSILFN